MFEIVELYLTKLVSWIPYLFILYFIFTILGDSILGRGR